jgi:hypothetical protein
MDALAQRDAAFRAGQAFYAARGSYLSARFSGESAEILVQQLFGAALHYELTLQPLHEPWARHTLAQLRSFVRSLSHEYNYAASRGRTTQKIWPRRAA